LPDGPGGELTKHAVLIRYFFGVDPYSLSDQDFAQLAAEASYLENRQNKFNELAMLEAQSRLFGKQ